VKLGDFGATRRKKSPLSVTEVAEFRRENFKNFFLTFVALWHNPDKSEPNRKKHFVFGFYESPG